MINPTAEPPSTDGVRLRRRRKMAAKFCCIVRWRTRHAIQSDDPQKYLVREPRMAGDDSAWMRWPELHGRELLRNALDADTGAAAMTDTQITRPIFRPGRYREQCWRRGTMQARKFHFASRAWEWSRAWFNAERGIHHVEF